MSNQKLADALRAMLPFAADAVNSITDDEKLKEAISLYDEAEKLLAEHDAAEHQEGLMIIGNPVDGFRFVGPFACESDGVEWAMQHAPNQTWTTATMQEPQA